MEGSIVTSCVTRVSNLLEVDNGGSLVISMMEPIDWVRYVGARLLWRTQVILYSGQYKTNILPCVCGRIRYVISENRVKDKCFRGRE